VAGALPQLRRLRRGLNEVLYAAYVWALFWMLAPLVWTAVAVSGRPQHTRPLIHYAARLILWLTRTPLKVSGLENLPRTPCVLAVNHASYLDGILLTAVLPPDFPGAFVAKREFMDHFVPRLFLRGIGAVFVERFDARLGVEHVENVAAALEQGQMPVFFPEGTFDRRPGLLAFRTGAFAIAARAGVPVTPVLVTVAPARTAKLTADPRATGAGPQADDDVDVVKSHTKLAASALPARSFTPVVIVAVYVVFDTRSLAGSKVAVRPA